MNRQNQNRFSFLRRFVDCCLALSLLALLLLLADVRISAGPFSLRSYGNPFKILLVLTALRTFFWGWPRLNSRQAGAAISIVLLAFAIPFLQPHAGSDGDFYYAYLRSMVVDGDFSLMNEAAWYSSGWMRDMTVHLSQETGYGYSGATIGLALWSAPIYIPVHLVMKCLATWGIVPLADGYTTPEKMAVALASLIGMLAGALFTYRLIRRWISPVPAALAVAVTVLSSPLLCYGYCEGSFSHALTFGLMAWWYKLWLDSRSRWSNARLFRLGFILGLGCLVRPQLLLFLILPWIDFLCNGVKNHRGWMAMRLAVTSGLILVAGWFIAFAPQMLVWYFERLAVFTAPQGEDYIRLGRLNHFKVLFDWYHGLFTWHPVHLVGFLSLPLAFRKNLQFLILLLVGFLFQLTLNASVIDWWAGGAFGQRRLETVLPLVAVGLGMLLEWAAQKRIPRCLLSVSCLLLVVWNVLLYAQVAEGPIYYDNPFNPQTIWSDQWINEGPESLGRFVVQSPLWRIVRNTAPDGPIYFVSALCAILLALYLIAVLTNWIVLKLNIRLPRSTSILPARWVIVSALLAMPFCIAHWNTERLTILVQNEDNIETRQLTVSNPSAYQGGALEIQIAPNQTRSLTLPHTIQAQEVILIGWLEDIDRWEDGVEIGSVNFDLASGASIHKPLVAGQHVVPRNYLFLRDQEYRRPGAHSVIRPIRGWIELTSTNQPNPYISTAAVYRFTKAENFSGFTITQKASSIFHLEGVAFKARADGSMQDTSGVLSNSQYSEPGHALDITPIANADYRHNPFRRHDAHGQWKFYPHLKPGWWRGHNSRFFIALPFDESGAWPVLTTANCDGTVWTLPLDQEIRRLQFLWCAFETLDPKLKTRNSRLLADIELFFPSGKVERIPIFSHRDVWDYRDRYASSKHQLRSDGFYHAKLHWQEVLVRSNDEAPIELVIRDANGRDSSGLALFAITAYPSTQP